MNLTLDIDDHLPDLYLTFIHTNLPLFEMVYHLNKAGNLNLKKRKKPVTLKRNLKLLKFDFYDFIDEQTEQSLWMIQNINYAKDQGFSLFSSMEDLETRHFLIKSQKQFACFIIHFEQPITPLLFDQLKTYPAIHSTKTYSIQDLKTQEQHLIQDIYYEKQD